MTKLLKKKKIFLKNKIINVFMKNGKKKTVEKIIVKFVKTFQKSSTKRFTTLFQSSIINATPVFSVNTQVIKRGKRKVTKDIPSFLSNNSIRVTTAMNFFKQSVAKDKKNGPFYEMLAKEVLSSASITTSSVVKKIDVQNQALLNKRYWSNFKW